MSSYKEEQILTKFKEQRILSGSFETQVKVGFKLAEMIIQRTKPPFPEMVRKRIIRRIDAICRQKDGIIWILEVEGKLNPTALGQVLIYGYLWKLDHPETSNRLRLGIVCAESDIVVEKVCEELGIEVFTVDPRS